MICRQPDHEAAGLIFLGCFREFGIGLEKHLLANAVDSVELALGHRRKRDGVELVIADDDKRGDKRDEILRIEWPSFDDEIELRDIDAAGLIIVWVRICDSEILNEVGAGLFPIGNEVYGEAYPPVDTSGYLAVIIVIDIRGPICRRDGGEQIEVTLHVPEEWMLVFLIANEKAIGVGMAGHERAYVSMSRVMR